MDFPAEILNNIFGNLPLANLIILRSVSIYYRFIIDDILKRFYPNYQDADVIASLIGHDEMEIFDKVALRFQSKEMILPCLAYYGDVIRIQKYIDQGLEWDNTTVSYAVKGGQLELLKWAKNQKLYISRNVCDLASHAGRLDIVQWALEHSYRFDKNTWKYAVAYVSKLKSFEEQTKHLLFYLKSDHPIDGDICSVVASYGLLNVLIWLQILGYRIPARAANKAAKHGHLNVIIYLFAQKLIQKKSDVYRPAMKYHQKHIIIWLIQNVISAHWSVIAGIRGYVSLDYDWIKSKKNADHLGFLAESLKYKNLEFFNWYFNTHLTSIIKQFDKHSFDGISFIDTVVKYNYLNVLILLKENHIRITDRIFETAVKYQRFDILLWLKNNCFDVRRGFHSCVEAASMGSLDTLQWLVKNGFMIYGCFAYDIAIKNGHTHILDWLISQFPDNVHYLHIEQLIPHAIANGHFQMIEWAEQKRRSLGFRRYWSTKYCIDWKKCFHAAIIGGQVKILQWLLSNKQPTSNFWSSMIHESPYYPSSHDKVVETKCLLDGTSILVNQNDKFYTAHIYLNQLEKNSYCNLDQEREVVIRLISNY